ncbi:histone H2A [Argonauta hians]
MSRLQFPVDRIHRLLLKGKYADRIHAEAPVYLTAVIEYLTGMVLELAGYASRDNNKNRILARHIHSAIGKDEELNKLLSGVINDQDPYSSQHSDDSSSEE